MTPPQRLIALLLAASCLVLSAIIITRTGLPERAAFTGQIIGGQQFAPETGFLAPPFDQNTINDQRVTSQQLRGQPVILNFWATWCVPCRVEMPALQQLHNDYHDRGLQIVGVNLGESPDAIQQWVTELDLTFDILPDPNGAIASQYYLLGQPSTYVISPDGRIINVFYGPVTADRLYDTVRRYLN